MKNSQYRIIKINGFYYLQIKKRFLFISIWMYLTLFERIEDYSIDFEPFGVSYYYKNPEDCKFAIRLYEKFKKNKKKQIIEYI